MFLISDNLGNFEVYWSRHFIEQPLFWVWCFSLDKVGKWRGQASHPHPVLVSVGTTHRATPFPHGCWQFGLDSLSDLASRMFELWPSKETLFLLSLVSWPGPCSVLQTSFCFPWLRTVPRMNHSPLAVLLLSLADILSSSDIPHLRVLATRWLGTLLSCALRVRSHPTPLEKILSSLAYQDQEVAPGW